MMKTITLIIPAFNEADALPLLYKEIEELPINNQRQYDLNILFINDGSTDNTLKVIKDLHDKDPRISYIDFSRNFGKEAAMLAGFDYAKGDCAVVMDADLQNPPHYICEMINKWEEGYDDVYGVRKTRESDSWLRALLSKSFYRLLQKTTEMDVLPGAGDFRLLDKKCIEALKKMREQERYTKGMFCWIGFKKIAIQYDHNKRITGKSSWGYFKLLKLAIEGITSFTTAPLRIATVIGIITSLISFFYMCFILFKTLIWGDPVQGFPTLITVILFLGGIQLLSLGIIGEYLGKIFNETKNRPVYVIREYQGS